MPQPQKTHPVFEQLRNVKNFRVSDALGERRRGFLLSGVGKAYYETRAEGEGNVFLPYLDRQNKYAAQSR